MIRWCLLFLLFLGLDAASKAAAIQWVSPMTPLDRVYPYGGIGIFPDFLGISFSLNYVVNTGAAWGLFSGHSGLLFAVRSCIIFGLIVYLLRSEKKPALWLVVTGAVGNILDYVLYGHVIDFFHFVLWGYSFPVFNLADSYITLGILGFLIFSRNEKTQCAS